MLPRGQHEVPLSSILLRKMEQRAWLRCSKALRALVSSSVWNRPEGPFKLSQASTRLLHVESLELCGASLRLAERLSRGATLGEAQCCGAVAAQILRNNGIISQNLSYVGGCESLLQGLRSSRVLDSCTCYVELDQEVLLFKKLKKHQLKLLPEHLLVLRSCNVYLCNGVGS